MSAGKQVPSSHIVSYAVINVSASQFFIYYSVISENVTGLHQFYYGPGL